MIWARAADICAGLLCLNIVALLGVGAAAQAELYAPGVAFFVDETGPRGDLFNHTITAHAAFAPVAWLCVAMMASSACVIQGRKRVGAGLFGFAVFCLVGLGVLTADLFPRDALLNGRDRIWTPLPALAPDSSAFLKVRPEVLAYIIAAASGPVLTIASLLAVKRQRGVEIMRWGSLVSCLISLAIAYRVTQTSSNKILTYDQTFSAHWLEATALMAAAIWALSLYVSVIDRRAPLVIPVAGVVLLSIVALCFAAMSYDAQKMGMPRRYVDYPEQFEFALKTASVFAIMFVAIVITILVILAVRRYGPTRTDGLTDAF